MPPSHTWAALAALIAACGAAPASQPDGRERDAALAPLEREVAGAVNAHRRSLGLSELAWSRDAAGLAREHSSAMAAGRVGFGHAGFEARTTRLREAVALRRAAENVSKHNGRPDDELPLAAMKGWLASDVHRRNIEGPFQLAGVGAARASDGTVFFTQIFLSVAEGAQRVPGARSSKPSLASRSASSDQSSDSGTQSMATTPSWARDRQSSRASGAEVQARPSAQTAHETTRRVLTASGSTGTV